MNDLKNETNANVKLNVFEWCLLIAVFLTPFVCAYISSQKIDASFIFGCFFWGIVIVLGKFLGFIR